MYLNVFILSCISIPCEWQGPRPSWNVEWFPHSKTIEQDTCYCYYVLIIMWKSYHFKCLVVSLTCRKLTKEAHNIQCFGLVVQCLGMYSILTLMLSNKSLYHCIICKGINVCVDACGLVTVESHYTTNYICVTCVPTAHSCFSSLYAITYCSMW